MHPVLVRYIPYFHRRAAAKRAAREARWDIIRQEYSLQPFFQCGSMILFNPFYAGPNPYNGPEVKDPKNRDNRFIVIHTENIQTISLGNPAVPFSSVS